MVKFPLLTILALIAMFYARCATAKPVDWNNRIGDYTLKQAVDQLGQPDHVARLKTGQTVAEWITYRRGGTRFNVGTGYYAGNGGFGAGLSTAGGSNVRILTLTFSRKNELIAWSKNY